MCRYVSMNNRLPEIAYPGQNLTLAYEKFTLRRAFSSCPIHRTHQRKKFTRLQRNPSAATIDDSTRYAIPRNYRGER